MSERRNQRETTENGQNYTPANQEGNGAISSREHQTVRTMALMVIRSREIPTQVRMVISRDRIARTVRMLMAPIRIRTVRADHRADLRGIRGMDRTVGRRERGMDSRASRELIAVRADRILIIRTVRGLLIPDRCLRRKRKRVTESCFLYWKYWYW